MTAESLRDEMIIFWNTPGGDTLEFAQYILKGITQQSSLLDKVTPKSDLAKACTLYTECICSGNPAVKDMKCTLCGKDIKND